MPCHSSTVIHWRRLADNAYCGDASAIRGAPPRLARRQRRSSVPFGSRSFRGSPDEIAHALSAGDEFLSRNGVASDERVTVISDDAGEFAKTVEGSQLARGRILDWFHIAMKFQAAQLSVFGSMMIDSMERESMETDISHAKWLVWHGKGSKAVERIKALDSRLLAKEGYEFKTLSMNLNGW